MHLEAHLFLDQSMGLADHLGVLWLAQEVRKVHHQIASGQRVVGCVAGSQNGQATHLPDSHLLHLQRERCMQTLTGTQHLQIEVLLVLVVVLFGGA